MEAISQAALNRASESWMQASRKLGIRVIAPYTLQCEGRAARCLAFLPDFGSPRGMVIGGIIEPKFDTDPVLVDLAKKMNLFYSFVNPVAYAEFDDVDFKEALMDWGYFGSSDNRPKWILDF